MDCLKNTNTEDEVMGEPVKLNVYDLTDMNGYLYWFGLGVYHSAIEGGLMYSTFPWRSKNVIAFLFLFLLLVYLIWLPMYVDLLLAIYVDLWLATNVELWLAMYVDLWLPIYIVNSISNSCKLWVAKWHTINKNACRPLISTMQKHGQKWAHLNDGKWFKFPLFQFQC